MIPATLLKNLASPAGRRLFRGLMRDRSSIFMLHRLDDPARGVHGHSVEFVREALTALRGSGATFVSLRAMVECWAAGRRVDPDWIAFTIDDGFDDQADLIERAFLPLHCPVTVFLISGFLDGQLWPWDDQLAFAFRETRLARATLSIAGVEHEVELGSLAAKHAALDRIRELCKKMSNADLYAAIAAIAAVLEVQVPVEPPTAFKAMSWERARKLEQAGVDFAPHSVTHRIFSRLSHDDARTELTTSWARLRSELRNPAPIFAWPTGRHTDFTERDIGIAREAGLLGSVATDDNYAHIGPHDALGLYRIKRFSLPTDIGTTLRYGSWVERARQFVPL